MYSGEGSSTYLAVRQPEFGSKPDPDCVGPTQVRVIRVPIPSVSSSAIPSKTRTQFTLTLRLISSLC